MKTPTTELCCPACNEDFIVKWTKKDVKSVGPLADTARMISKTIFYTTCPKCGFQVLVREDISSYDHIDKHGVFTTNANKYSQS